MLLSPILLGIAYVVFDGFWAVDFATTHGCRVDEAGTYPCIVDGKDWGPTLGRKTSLVTLMSFIGPIVILPFLLLVLFILKDLIVYLLSKRTKK